MGCLAGEVVGGRALRPISLCRSCEAPTSHVGVLCSGDRTGEVCGPGLFCLLTPGLANLLPFPRTVVICAVAVGLFLLFFFCFVLFF